MSKSLFAALALAGAAVPAIGHAQAVTAVAQPIAGTRLDVSATGEVNRVPDIAIFAIRKRLEPPALEEGFDRLFSVSLDEEKGTFEVAPYSR